MKIKLYFAYTQGNCPADCLLQSWLDVILDNLAQDYPDWLVSKNTGPDGYNDCDLFVGIIDRNNTALGVAIATAISRYGRPILLVSLRFIYRDSKNFLEVADTGQVMCRSLEFYQCIDGAIKDAVEEFKLGTPHPVTFPCLESFKTSPIYGNEGGAYGAVQAQRLVADATTQE